MSVIPLSDRSRVSASSVKAAPPMVTVRAASTALSLNTRHPGRAAARSEKGLASVALGAKALALTALDLIEDPALLMKIKQDHAKAVAEQ